MADVRAAAQEAEQARADLHRKLEALSEKLSVPNILSEASNYFSTEGSKQFAYNLANQAKANPFAVTMMGVGLTWLMMGRRGSRGSYESYDLPSSERWRERAGQLGSRASEWGDRASEWGERASEWGERASARGQQAREVIGARAQNAAARGREFYESVADNYDRQPLVFGAVAFALGSALSAAFAPTRFEHEYFGQMGEQAREQAAELAEKGMETVKPAASAAYEAGKSEVEKETETGSRQQRQRSGSETVSGS